MEQEKVVTWLIDFIGSHVVINGRDLTMEEIENIVNTICAAGEGVQGIKTRCKIIPQGGRQAGRAPAPLKKSLRRKSP